MNVTIEILCEFVVSFMMNNLVKSLSEKNRDNSIQLQPKKSISSSMMIKKYYHDNYISNINI